MIYISLFNTYQLILICTEVTDKELRKDESNNISFVTRVNSCYTSHVVFFETKTSKRLSKKPLLSEVNKGLP